MQARVIKVDPGQSFGRFAPGPDGSPSLDTWEVAAEPAEAVAQLREVGAYLRARDVPVAFPTETVYGLGADATRSAAVRGIYAAKARPADNPLIVHVSDLAMLRALLPPPSPAAGADSDPIPPIYRPLIARFWPGPLTILLPNPRPSRLAPEVTAGQPAFGARMPAAGLARSLIALAARPLAAPSANASTRPSPTAAAHVLEDLAGRIELVLDGGPCGVGVESTVVDGLCVPPAVLRPGGVGIAELRQVPGWEGVRKAYRDRAGTGAEGTEAPRAPGMKYKHYSPRARVVLYEAGAGGRGGVASGDVEAAAGVGKTVAVIRTREWPAAGGLSCSALRRAAEISSEAGEEQLIYTILEGELLGADGEATGTRVLELDLGRDIKGIAQGLFSALRELDRRGADVILIEGVGDEDDIAGAVMNRLRKAASDIR